MDVLNVLLKERNGYAGKNINDTLWVIKESSYGGRGLFAVRDIAAGELIFKDVPTITGPRSSESTPGCSICMVGDKPLTACPEGCGLPVCYGQQCEQLSSHKNDCKLLRQLAGDVDSRTDPGHWSPQLYKALGLLRCLNIPQREREIVRLLYANKCRETEIQISQLKHSLPNGLTEQDEQWLLHCCGVLDGTAFEVPHNKGEGNWSLRGLYPLAAMMNHCCSPNARLRYSTGFDIEQGNGPTMTVIASTDIPKDSEITTMYCPQLWSTPARRQFLLMTKKFLCNCCRCQDPTEFGTYLSAMKCPCNNGLLLPARPLDLDSPWVCDSCAGRIEAKKALAVQTVATKLDLIERCVILPPSNYLIVGAKLESVRKSTQKISSLSVAELSFNENTIRDLINLLEKLRLGKSRMSGLLLMELYKTIEELAKRNNNDTQHSDELMKIWSEANAILEGDLVAPKIRRH